MRSLLMAVALSVASVGALAQTQIQGQTFAVTADQSFGLPGGPYGYVTMAEPVTAGMWGESSEWIAARSEFDLAGQQAAGSVWLSFHFLDMLAPAAYGPIPMALGWYTGDNAATVSDFNPGLYGLATLDLAGLGAGEIVHFDVTSLFNEAVVRGDAAFGVGIDNRTLPNTFARFESFTLTVSAVPEPATYALMLGGLAMVGVVARRRRLPGAIE
jgi:hypothetical protein